MKKKGNELKNKIRRTSEWKSFRKKIISERGSKCECCGKSTKLIQLHHADNSIENYEDFNPSKFFLLCASCHKEVTSLEAIKPCNWYKIRNKDWVDLYRRFIFQ